MIVYPFSDDVFTYHEDDPDYIVAEEYHHILHEEMNDLYDPDTGGGFI